MNKKTKIVCTIGPASEKKEVMRELLLNGMNVVRLNFSHGDYQEHGARIETARELALETGLPLALLLDTKGPEIRLGDFANGKEEFTKGDIVKISKAPMLGTKEMFHVQVPEVFEDVVPGNYILINDGKQKLTILENDGEFLTCRVEVTAPIGSRKGCNIPGVKLSMPFVSEKDEADIRFGCKQKVDYIAASFVRRPEDVLEIRAILKDEGCEDIQIFPKIENQEGFDNLEAILEVSDGVMVARGDLGVEVETQFVPIYQKRMIKTANILGKPVITATHMLDSMTENPRCTRAEASDVANAVLDGTDAVMLSAESAAGLYPVEAVKTMATIAAAAEGIIDYRERLEVSKRSSNRTVQDAIGISIADAALNLDVQAIVVFTQGGTTAKRISKFRPCVPIIAATFDEKVRRALVMYCGVKPVISDVQNNLTNDDELASKIAKENGFLPGQLIIISAGYPTGEGTANMMKIIKIK